jgi:uncharacterized protein
MTDPSRSLLAELLDAAVCNRPRAQQLLADHPELLQARLPSGETALHFLAVEGQADAVRLLAEAGADVNTVDAGGHTPLVDVACLGNAEVATILLARGADPNATSSTVDNVLHAAVRSGNHQLVDALLTAGADSRYETDLGETVFDALPADPAARDELLRILAKHGVGKGAA